MKPEVIKEAMAAFKVSSPNDMIPRKDFDIVFADDPTL